MKQFKGTPGPWVIDANNVGSLWNVDDLKGESIALSHQVANDKDWSKRNANTALIAAAPELLEALQGFVDLFPDVIDGDAIMPALDAAEAAIAKALGEK